MRQATLESSNHPKPPQHKLWLPLLAAVVLLAALPEAAAGGPKKWRGNRLGNQRSYHHYQPLLRDLPRGKVVDSQIRHVEVYVGRALIERVAQVELPRGSHRLVLPALPWSMNASTLNMAGFGADAVAGSTFLEEGTMVEARPRKLRSLEKALKKIEYRDEGLGNQAAILQGEKVILMKVLSSASPGAAGSNLSVTLHQARSELSRITGKLTKVGRQRKALAPKLATLRKAHADLLTKLRRRVRHVVVEVRALRACKLKLKIRYVVHGPTWRARHEGRYDAASRRLRLDTYAWVVQQTGERWDNVSIRVGNARPTSGLLPPYPRDRQVVLQAAGARVAGVSSRLREVAQQSYYRRVAAGSMRQFLPSGRFTVPTGPQGRRILVATTRMASTPRYVAIPMEHPGAFLKLELKNSSSEALMAGEAALFNGQDYVGTARVPSVLPGEQLVLPFGRDNQVQVTRTRLSRERKVTGARQKLTLKYRFKVENKRGHIIDLELREVLPRTIRQQRARVTMHRGTPAPQKGPRGSLAGLLLWKLQVSAGGTKQWSWGFDVAAPRGKRIVGVD